MRVLVVYHRWGYGGGDATFYYAIKGLHEAGFKVLVAAMGRPDLKPYFDLVGEVFPRGIEVYSSFPYILPTIYGGLYGNIISSFALERLKYDVAISFSNIIPMGEAPILCYIHFPLPLSWDARWNPGYPKYSLKHPSVAGLRGFLASVFWNSYARPYEIVAWRFYSYQLEVSDRILVNSTFTFKALKYTLLLLRKPVKDMLGKTRILHPPLPRIHEYVNVRSREKKPCVTTIGRFSPEKRYELILKTARITPEVEYYIAGEVTEGISRGYYEKIRREAPLNIKVIANITHRLKLELLSKCTAYLHTMVGEHFGIAPLEALAAGATPIVPQFSGTWTDVCLEGEYCYGYTRTDPRTLAEKILEAIEKPKMASLEHLEKFSPEKFMKEIVREVEKLGPERSH